jgi:hypothetical protein
VRIFHLLLFLLFAFPVLAQTSLKELASQIREAGLDPTECYRVRDLNFSKEDARFYLTDGILIFGREVAGRRFSAVFIGEIEGGDAEILLFPPLRSERMSLAKFIESPNLNEHFKLAIFFFTDNTHADLLKTMQEKLSGRPIEEAGALYADKYSDTVNNLSEGLAIRLVQAIESSSDRKEGFFFATLRSQRVGNFDFIYDPMAHKQIRIGQYTTRQDVPFYDYWAVFPTKNVLMGRKDIQPPNYEVEHYNIEASLDEDLLLRAKTRLRIRPNVPIATAALRISSAMSVTSASLNGAPVEVFQPESTRANTFRKDRDTTFIVDIPGLLSPGETAEIEIAHEGRVIADAGYGVYHVGSRGRWYPSPGERFATYDVRFEIPGDLDFVATQDQMEVTKEAGRKTISIQVETPVRTFGFNIGRYDSVTVKENDFEFTVYANEQVEEQLQPDKQLVLVPEGGRAPRTRGSSGMAVRRMPMDPPISPALRLKQLAGETSDAMQYMTELLGPPPLRKISISPIPGHFGQGFAGIVYLSTMSYLPENRRPGFVRDTFSSAFFSNLLMPHELAHQWWGNVVYAAEESDVWLMEGLANYTALMFIEEKRKAGVVRQILARYREDLLIANAEGEEMEDAGPIVWGDRLSSSRNPNAWQVVTYERGTWIFHMLRAQLGDDNFRLMLREILTRYNGKAFATKDLEKLAAEFIPKNHPDRNLSDFFAQWVYGYGVPRIDFTKDVKPQGGRFLITGEVKCTEVADDFGTLVPLTVTLPGDKQVTRWVRSSVEGESYRIRVDQRPLKIELDPDFQLLRRD